VIKRRKAVQDLHQVGGAELRRSTGCRDLLCEPEQFDPLAAGHLGHGCGFDFPPK
jgi:hypothetical protein